MPRYLPALLLALSPSVASAQANAIVPDPDPEIERKSFIVAPGFEVNLYAADPLLAKPIQMNFDPAGRLWVATSEVYPQIKPGQKANDKVIILEDTKGVGRADTVTVFADGLLIPTGVAPGDGGAYVANSTEIVHLSASKPGGKADRSRVVLSGFGTEDTHHIIHTFRWGPDSALYFNQSIYIHSHVETPHGVRRLNAGGIWRFRPWENDLSVFARGWVNSWGHQFDRYGQSLVTDGAGGEGVNHAVPGAYYLTATGPHAHRVLHGMTPGSPKYCANEIISGRHFPDDWQGNVVTNDFRGHRVCRFALRDDGSTYEARELQEVIKTAHPAFRPIDVAMGPDGALYIADWYNPIIQHGEVDFRDPRRDHTHGRIWRVTAKGRPLVPRPNLETATVAELLERLKDPEDWTRARAKRVLKERVAASTVPPGGNPVPPELAAWQPPDDRTRLELAWVYQSLGVVDQHQIQKLMNSQDGNIRAAAVRILSAVATDGLRNVSPAGGKIDTDWQAPRHLAVKDDHPRVRLEAVRSIAKDKSESAVVAALAALDRPTDKTLDYALWLTVRELEPQWMPAFAAGRIDFGGDAKKIAFALEAIGNASAVKPLLGLIQSGKLPPDREPAMWQLVARLGGPGELLVALGRATDPKTPPAERAALLAALDESARLRNARPLGDAAKVVRLIDPADEVVTPHAVRLVGRWKLGGEGEAALAKAAADGKPAVRLAALESLGLHGGKAARAALDRFAREGAPADRAAAVAALAGLDLPAAAASAAALLASPVPSDSLTPVFAAFLGRKNGAAELAKALAGKTLPADAAKVGLRAVRAASQPAPTLADALTKAGNLAAARKDPTPDEVKAYVADALKSGDPARGEVIFRRKELQCLNCHGVGGAGGQVGPDLTSIGASAQPDYLVESLLLPNKAVKEGYHAVRANTLDGKQVPGIKLRETDKEVVLRTAEDKELTLPKADLDGPLIPSRSLMPDGTTDPLTRQEFLDLTRFLGELGKLGPYAPAKARLVRRWEVLDPTPDALNRVRRARVSAAAENPAQFPWVPAYSRVAGELPVDDVPQFVVWNGTAAQSVVRCRLDVSAAGPVKLKINDPAGLTLYVGSTTADLKPETVLDLKAGPQTLTFVIDRAARAGPLSVELDDVPGSPARAAVAGGK